MLTLDIMLMQFDFLRWHKMYCTFFIKLEITFTLMVHWLWIKDSNLTLVRWFLSKPAVECSLRVVWSVRNYFITSQHSCYVHCAHTALLVVKQALYWRYQHKCSWTNKTPPVWYQTVLSQDSFYQSIFVSLILIWLWNFPILLTREYIIWH